MKRSGMMIFVLAVMTGFMTGCAVRGEFNEMLTTAEISEYIQQEVEFSEMQQRDANDLQRIYRIDASTLADFVLYTSLSNVRADELAMIKVKDVSEVESIMDLLGQRINSQTIKFKDYLPEEYDLIEHHLLKSIGPFIFFAVSKDVNSLERRFDDALVMNR